MNRSFPNAVLLSLIELRSLLRRISVAYLLILFSRHPQPMQKHRELASHSDHSTLLGSLAAALRQLQSKSTKLRIGTEGPQNVLRCTDLVAAG